MNEQGQVNCGKHYFFAVQIVLSFYTLNDSKMVKSISKNDTLFFLIKHVKEISY